MSQVTFDETALAGAFKTLTEELAKSLEQQDREKIAKTLGEASEQVAALKAKGYTAGGELAKQLDQLTTGLTKMQEELIEVRKTGLSYKDHRIVIPGGRAARLDMLEDKRAFADEEMARRCGAWFVSTMLRARNELGSIPEPTKALAEDVKKAADIDPTVAGAGAELVPNEFRAELIRNVEATGVYYPQMRRVPLVTMGTTTFPKRTGGLTAYPTAVAAQIQQSGIAFGTVTLQPEKWATLTGIPNEFYYYPAMLADVGNLVGVEIVLAIQEAFDNAVINGDGGQAYGGITGILQSANIASVAAAATHTTLDTVDGADVGDVIANLSKGYALGKARWGFHLSVRGKLRNLRTTTGAPLYLRGGNGDPNTIDDFPYTYGPAMPAAGTITGGDKYAFFGDLSISHYFGMVRNIQIDTSKDVWFASDMTAVRGIVFADCQEADADAVVVAKTAAV